MSEQDVCWMACRAAVDAGLFLQLGSNVVRGDLRQLNEEHLAPGREIIPFCFTASPGEDVSEGLIDFSAFWFSDTERMLYSNAGLMAQITARLQSIAGIFRKLIEAGAVEKVVLFFTDDYDIEIPVFECSTEDFVEQFHGAVQSLPWSATFMMVVRSAKCASGSKQTRRARANLSVKVLFPECGLLCRIGGDSTRARFESVVGKILDWNCSEARLPRARAEVARIAEHIFGGKRGIPLESGYLGEISLYVTHGSAMTDAQSANHGARWAAIIAIVMKLTDSARTGVLLSVDKTFLDEMCASLVESYSARSRYEQIQLITFFAYLQGECADDEELAGLGCFVDWMIVASGILLETVDARNLQESLQRVRQLREGTT